MNVNLIEHDGLLAVNSPFNREFAGGARKLGGKWNPDLKAWMFPTDIRESVHALLLSHYGWAPAAAAVKIRLTATNDVSAENGPCMAGVVPVVAASGRDTGAFPCDGVSVLSGVIRSGGSAKYWKTLVRKGTVCVVRDVPESALGTIDADSDWTYEVMRPEPKQDGAAIAEMAAEIKRRAASQCVPLAALIGELRKDLPV